MKTLCTVSILTLFSLLSGCDTVPTTSPQQMGQLQAQGKARVVAPHSTFWAGFDIGSHIDMSILSVDGRSVKGDDEIELAAGKHQLGVGCNFSTRLMTLGPGAVTAVTLDMDLQAGHLYQLKPIGGDAYECAAAIDDVTGSDAPAGQDSHTGEQARSTLDHRRAQTKPVMDEWENLALYHSPPADYEVIGAVVGQENGFLDSGKVKDAIEGLKKTARMEGATGVLLVVPDEIWGPQRIPAPPAGTGVPVYGTDGKFPIYWDGVWVAGLAIYVPADADAFQKAAHAHSITCIALFQKKDDAKAAYKAVKSNGTSDAVAAAKQALQAAEDAEEAAYCGDDDWYAEQMTGQKD